jgi:hypothetical protein
MPEIEEIAARVAVLETVMRQLLTHMAVRAEDPPRWIETRRVLASSALASDADRTRGQGALLHEAIAGLFDQAELVAREYAQAGMPRGNMPKGSMPGGNMPGEYARGEYARGVCPGGIRRAYTQGGTPRVIAR